MRKTLTQILVLSSVSLSGCYSLRGSNLIFEGDVGEASVVWYSADSFFESYRMEVLENGVKTIYVDRDWDGVVDYNERIEDRKEFIDFFSQEEATEKYQNLIREINKQD